MGSARPRTGTRLEGGCWGPSRPGPRQDGHVGRDSPGPRRAAPRKHGSEAVREGPLAQAPPEPHSEPQGRGRPAGWGPAALPRGRAEHSPLLRRPQPPPRDKGPAPPARLYCPGVTARPIGSRARHAPPIGEGGRDAREELPSGGSRRATPRTRRSRRWVGRGGQGVA